MPKQGSINLYIHGNLKARLDGQPRTATWTLTQLLNYDLASVDVKQNVLVQPPRPLCPSDPAVAGCVGAAAGAPCVGEMNSGKSLHCFLVGVNESYVTANADL